MAADDDFTFIPPRRVRGDDVLVYEEALGGEVPFWKALLFRTCQRREQMRSDGGMARADGDASEKERIERDDRRLRAEEKERWRRARIRQQETDLLARCDALLARLDAMAEREAERERAAHAQRSRDRAARAMEEAEAFFTVAEDGTGMTRH
jgi:hypothetical protein